MLLSFIVKFVLYLSLYCEKNENKQKEAVFGPFFNINKKAGFGPYLQKNIASEVYFQFLLFFAIQWPTVASIS